MHNTTQTRSPHSTATPPPHVPYPTDGPGGWKEPYCWSKILDDGPHPTHHKFHYGDFLPWPKTTIIPCYPVTGSGTVHTKVTDRPTWASSGNWPIPTQPPVYIPVY
ncbi:hypothetical protein BU16DRAFT_534236 [Lophium mytilinum]|uniref:Uncharacterized protein n=1 Tax=Lophium mytilinum TaxID=390894 RepID=A0A6A6RAK7_9PEZI|nr:hypothetical protein BU16DRAFT_534236 [Lophium mytilinum]